MSWIDFLGFSAAFSVLASFCMTTIVALSAFKQRPLHSLWLVRPHLPRACSSYYFASDQFGQTSPNEAESHSRKSLNSA
jgi:hypothetical protein